MIRRALVIGGGIAGMNAALSLARQGFDVTLVEKEPELGGFSRRLHHTIEGNDVQEPTCGSWSRGDRAENPGPDPCPDHRFRRDTRATSRPRSSQGRIRRPADHRARRDRGGHGRGGIPAHGVPLRGGPACSPRSSWPTGWRQRERRPFPSVVMIQCVGSRSEAYPECSRICCQNAVKNALRIKRAEPRDPGLRALQGPEDLRSPGRLLHPGKAEGCSSSSGSIPRPPPVAEGGFRRDCSSR